MPRHLLSRLPLWNEPTAAADNAVAALLDELVTGVGHVLHGDTVSGRGRHVMISAHGVDVVRVVSMAGPLAVAPGADGVPALLAQSDDVSHVLRWIDDVTDAMRESFDGVGADGQVRGWLCVLDAEWNGGADELVVRGHRVVRLGALAHGLRHR
jgi:hypothetical protein